MKEICVEQRIIESANTKVGGKWNLAQYKKAKEKMMKHKAICEAIVAFKKENVNMPMYAILSTGVSAGAFKNSEFDKGYRSFDAEKVKTIYEMAKAYNEKMKIQGMPNDVTYRICNKFYNKVSKDIEVWKKNLANAKVLDDNRGHFKELCMNVGISA